MRAIHMYPACYASDTYVSGMLCERYICIRLVHTYVQEARGRRQGQGQGQEAKDNWRQEAKDNWRQEAGAKDNESYVCMYGCVCMGVCMYY